MPLPYSRTINVTLSRRDAFPTRRGFGTVLIATTESKNGVLDAMNLTRSYATLAEVEADFAVGTKAQAAAASIFRQSPNPIQIKLGFVATASIATKALMITALNAIRDVDNDWYWLTGIDSMRDNVAAQGMVEWVESQMKFAMLDSNDDETENSTSVTSIAGLNKNLYERTGVFYHTDATVYPAAALASILGTRNFDEARSSYTSKYKRLIGIAPLNKTSAVVQAVTGFTPQLGQSITAGHMANTIVDIGGRFFVVEGSTLTPNVFIDEIHSSDWIVARTEEELLGILLNEPKVPFTDRGMRQLASAVHTVMNQARRAGMVAEDLDPLTGEYAPAIQVTIPSVFDVPEVQRKNRVAPAIQCKFRYSGAVHYTTIRYEMTF